MGSKLMLVSGFNYMAVDSYHTWAAADILHAIALNAAEKFGISKDQAQGALSSFLK